MTGILTEAIAEVRCFHFLTRQKHGRRSELPLLCMLIYVSMDYNPFSNFRLLSSILATAAS
ncbi:hypothetical protein [Peribacillus simplex]|uniref:hypothetical protein n=1 Tax=Peribacillus simplex TaxID=1478 RepID=UPI0024C16C87|nr:hypothetical protein [Peribacillus simplex]WHY59045.1 hypothetical protein QNH43_12640 [Peribacillus simplex]